MKVEFGFEFEQWNNISRIKEVHLLVEINYSRFDQFCYCFQLMKDASAYMF